MAVQPNESRWRKDIHVAADITSGSSHGNGQSSQVHCIIQYSTQYDPADLGYSVHTGNLYNVQSILYTLNVAKAQTCIMLFQTVYAL